MKKILSVLAVLSLAGCAMPSKFSKDSADTGFVVLSTAYSDECKDTLNNVNMLADPVDKEKQGFNAIIRNPLFKPNFEENNARVYARPVWAGAYHVGRVMKPNILFAAAMNYYDITNKIPLQVEAGKIQYLGSFLLTAKNGECTLENLKITHDKNRFKERDMKKAAEENPEVFAIQAQ